MSIKLSSVVIIALLSVPSRILALDEITVSYPGPAPFYIPIQIALRRGYFHDQKLDVKLIVTNSSVDRAALVSGSIDFSLRATSTVLSAARGLPVRIVLVGTTRPFWSLVVRPETNSVQDLKRKVVGIAGIAGAHHLTSKVILEAHGLDPDRDVVTKVVTAGTRIPALTSGSIDGVLMGYDEAFRAKREGMKILLNAADYHTVLSLAVGVNLQKMREKPDQVKRFIRAHLQGMKAMREDRETALKIMMDWMKLDREMAQGVYDLSVNNFTRDGLMEEAALKKLMQEILTGANLKEEVAVSQAVDFKLLREVLEQR
jgi:ABC-type nitrate/sulfonate/bicarbonate transport system substrate-binding protein